MVSAVAKSFNDPDDKNRLLKNVATIKLENIALTNIQLEQGWK